tara:strand:+ start:468 stop:1454 length:987 start_codon:yes stop_codon:yes gene_type:complete
MKILTNIFLAHAALNFAIYYFFDHLKSKIAIYDYPEPEKKIHKKPTLLMGGWIFLFNLILFVFLKYFSLSIIEVNILLCSFFFLLVGIADDKYNLSPYSKFFSLTFALIVFFSFSENVLINNIRLYNYNIHLHGDIKIFFSVLCALLFVNAFNLFDGINLQSIFYGIYFLIFLAFKALFLEIIFFILISLILVAYLNYKNKIFMGDSGTLFLGSIISLLVMTNYANKNFHEVDEIFLLMFLPGVDMFRLFLQRMLSRKNPFMGDREHLHHYLLELYGYRCAIFSILGIAILPSILNIFIDSKFVIAFFIIFYFLFFIFLKKKIIKKSI